jgi:hypothetical protein
VHDTTDLEGRGVPCVYVASEEFRQAGVAQARALGFEAAAVFVPHPIHDRTDDEMRALADNAVGEIVARLTKVTDRLHPRRRIESGLIKP